MAIDLNGKKTSLEDGSIYEKRDENIPEKERIKNMTPKEKRQHFNTYYLPKVLIGLAVIAVAFFIFWSDFNKKDVYLNCAVLNETISAKAYENFSNNFTKSIGMDESDNEIAFQSFFTKSEAGAENGQLVPQDLTALTSKLVAKSIDCFIAAPQDINNYMEKGFFDKLDEKLSKKDLEKISKHAYKVGDHIYGIRLKDSKAYKEMIKNEISVVSDPVLLIIVNAEQKNKDYAVKLINYFYPE